MPSAIAESQISVDKSEILSLLQSAERAHHDKDAASIVAPYTDDAVIYSLAPPLSVRPDRNEVQEWLETWNGPVDYKPRDFNIIVNGDLAFCYGFTQLGGNKKGVDHRVSFWMRETLCLLREGGAWRIVHRHTSVPFYMDGSLRPAFDLEPPASPGTENRE